MSSKFSSAGNDLLPLVIPGEPLTVMFEDVPSKVRDFFKHRRLNQIIRRARASIGL